MNRINYNMKEHGFVGHLSIPEQSTKYGVIVIMGGEQSILPGTLIADRFIQGVLLSYLYMIVLFAWDTFFLDWILFANIKRLRLPGTEHMEREYHQKWFHIKACIPMIPVFMIGGILSSLLMTWIW